jgi:tetratricopeptide (TPR) repeat protein
MRPPILDRLTKSDPANTELQRDLGVSYNKVGNNLAAMGDLIGALNSYQASLDVCKRLVSLDGSNTQWHRDLTYVIAKIGALAQQFLVSHDFTSALETADLAISEAPDLVRLYTNRAHALMFLRRTDEARSVYFKYRGVKNVLSGKSWETVILEDFAELRKVGLMNPLMDEIERVFTSAG